MAKLAKICTLRLTLDKLYFILSERAVNGGVGVWCELTQSHFFNEYNLDGVAEDANEILLELSPDSMVRCLKTAQNAKSVKIKLTKKRSPCLTFEIELPSLAANSRVVVHDIPVHVIPRRLWDEFNEPEMPDYDVTLYMPSLKIVRNVVDRMKNLSNFVIIYANQAGEMKLKVETSLATVTTYFRNLEQPTWSKDGSQQLGSQKGSNRDEFSEARVDIRKLAQFLTTQQVNPAKVICNIVDQHVVHFLLLHEDVSLQYFMPVVSS